MIFLIPACSTFTLLTFLESRAFQARGCKLVAHRPVWFGWYVDLIAHKSGFLGSCEKSDDLVTLCPSPAWQPWGCVSVTETDLGGSPR